MKFRPSLLIVQGMRSLEKLNGLYLVKEDTRYGHEREITITPNIIHEQFDGQTG